MSALLAICGRELRTRLRDGSALVVAFVAPVIIASLFSVALGGQHPPLRATLGIVDLDGGAIPTRAMTEIFASAGLRDVVSTRSYPDLPAAQAAVRAKDIGAAMLFPAGFSTRAGEGRGGEITVIRSTDSPLAGIVAQSAADGFAAKLGAEAVAARVAEAVRGAQAPTPIAQPAPTESPAPGTVDVPLALTGDPLAGGPVQAAAYYGPGMALLFVFFVAGATVRSLLTERQLGTLARMYAAPIHRWTVLAGKGLIGFLIALASMGITWATSVALFGVSWGDPLAVIVLCTAEALAATALILMVAGGARTEGQSIGYTTFVAFVLGILGGNFVPLYQLPASLQRVALLTPNGWAMRGFTTLTAGGGDLSSIKEIVGVILGIAALCAAIGAVRFRRGLGLAR
jgi:ABC-2 type transport system permease protein